MKQQFKGYQYSKMIKLSINQKDIDILNKELELKVEAIGKMKSQEYLDIVARAAFVIIGEKFLQATDRFSVTNPKRMHHIYEWGKVGRPNARLFVLNKVSLVNGLLTIESKFKQSRVPVPIDPELLVPGNNGKIVSRKNIFREKADVMEKGDKVSFQAQRILAFYGRDGLRFIQPGKQVVINNPGGKYTKGAFSSFMIAWYNKNAQVVMNSSGLFEKIAAEASIVLSKTNGGPEDVRRATIKVVESIIAGKEVLR